MRIAILLALVLPLAAAADTPKGWRTGGICVTPWPSQKACIQVNAGDAKTIQKLIIDYASRRTDYKAAKKLAEQPITDAAIGAFTLMGYEFVGFTGEVLEAVAVESHQSGTEIGFRVTLGRKAGRWSVLYFEHYRHKDPKPNY